VQVNSRKATRLDPKLRMILNGDEEVNTRRAELSGSVITSQKLVDQFPQQRTLAEKPGLPTKAALPEPPPFEGVSDEVIISVFVELEREAIPAGMPQPTAQRGRLVTAELSQRQVDATADEEGIAYIFAGAPLIAPNPIEVPQHIAQPVSRQVRSQRAESGGKGILIGLVDIGGFDFTHPDFLDEDQQTRFLTIWDQGLTGHPPKGFDYGTELTQDQINAALTWSREHDIGATDLLPQSLQLSGSHATHVAGIAAGNHGVCPQATIVGVQLALTDDEQDRRRSFYDSARLAHAVDYLCGLGQKHDMPVVVNISLGTNGHAHDGSSPICRWIDAALNVPGRCVCVAAGNAGQEAPQFNGDFGALMGRIHTSGRLPASGLVRDFEWLVIGNGIADGSENELEIWYEPQDRFEVQVRTPDGHWFGPVQPGQFIQNKQLTSGTFLSIYSERYHPSNGANRIAVYLSPRLKEPCVGVQAGTWVVRLRGLDVRHGQFHAWIERDDPRPLGRIGSKEVWRFPSTFTRTSNVDDCSINTLACGHRVVAVANYEETLERINCSSSQGPTRDGRYKPEVAAPGTNIIAPRGFAGPQRRWVALSGTSMSSPYVAGVAALMLAVERRLTASQIIGIIRRTAQPLPGGDYPWQNNAGFGLIQPERCLEEAAAAFLQEELADDAA
jgi:subtilisin family serine protease